MNLYEACFWGDDDRVFQLLLANKDLLINYQHPLSGHTALMAAAINENDLVVQALLRVKDIDVNIKSYTGKWTATELTNCKDIKRLIENKKRKL